MLAVQLETAGRTESVELADPFFVVCGFTGRDEEVVAAHVRELEEIGVAPPPTVPVFIPIPAYLLVPSGQRVEVMSANTSGEAEPVLIHTTDGRNLLAAGSDHTDRALEISSIAAGKAACPKVLSRTVWDLAEVGQRWDEFVLTSASNGAPPHHRAPLAAIKPPAEILAALHAALELPENRPLVVFLGTLAGSGAEVAGEGSFSARIDDPASGRTLECSYRFEDVSRAPRRQAA